MSPITEKINPDVISIMMIDVGKKVFSNLEFTKYPEFETEQIIEYNSRMRLSPLAKFNGPCYISVINLYAKRKDMEQDNTLGALIFYLNEDSCGKVLKRLNFSHFDEDEEQEVMELSGKVIRSYADQMLISLRTLNYMGLILSEPKNFKNSVPGGVNFHYSETDLYSVSFFAYKEKRMIVELTLAPSIY